MWRSARVFVAVVFAVAFSSALLAPSHAQGTDGSTQGSADERIAAIEQQVKDLAARVEKLERLISLLQAKLDTGTGQPTQVAPPTGPDYTKFKWANITHWTVTNRQTGAVIGYTMKGEVTNETGRDFSYVTFSLTLYDVTGKVIGSGSFSLTGLRNGQTKPFEVTVYGVDPNKIWDWNLEYDRGF